VTLVPVAAGLKYLFSNADWLDIYLGAGVLGTYLHTKDHSPFVVKSVHKWGVGGIWKLGGLFYLYKGLFLDIFADYSYIKIHFHHTHGGKLVRHTADVSGVSAGGGIGWKF
jgi:hypothetical protein